jgi:hypothetical protein
MKNNKNPLKELLISGKCAEIVTELNRTIFEQENKIKELEKKDMPRNLALESKVNILVFELIKTNFWKQSLEDFWLKADNLFSKEMGRMIEERKLNREETWERLGYKDIK